MCNRMLSVGRPASTTLNAFRPSLLPINLLFKAFRCNSLTLKNRRMLASMFSKLPTKAQFGPVIAFHDRRRILFWRTMRNSCLPRSR